MVASFRTAHRNQEHSLPPEYKARALTIELQRSANDKKCSTTTETDCTLPQDHGWKSPLAALPVICYLLWAP